MSRLTREGLRFDKFLVASACRSCYDPFCMVGCPVGSIHREVGKEVVIKDWCIGCGKCAENCPYGNINLHPIRDDEGEQKLKAFTCDLCTKINAKDPLDKPSCVYACPHDAAHRMTGPQLWQIANPLRAE
ncbi:MAG: 4Fe-4S dicluster domain-containing protein [Pirellulales bacterium]